MQTGRKFPCRPSHPLRLTLAQRMGYQRFVHNAKVREDHYFRTFIKHRLGLTDVRPPNDQAYSQDRELTPFPYDVPSQILRNGAVRHKKAKRNAKAGLARRPVVKRKGRRQSVRITKEPFRFATGPNGTGKIILGTPDNPVGVLEFSSHLPCDVPDSIAISRQGGMWQVSFSHDDGLPEPDDAAILAHYASMSRDELEKITNAFDRGVAIPVAATAASGAGRDYSKGQRRNLDKLDKRRTRCRKKMSRQKPGSKRRGETAAKIARSHVKSTYVCHDFAHQASHAIATSSREMFVGENLEIANMVRRRRRPANRTRMAGSAT